MIKRRIKYPAQGRNEDYKFGGGAPSVLGVSTTTTGGGSTSGSWLEQYFNFDFANDRLKVTKTLEVDDLVINGTVDRWLSETLIVEDARIRINRTQDAATVAAGLDVWNGSSIVSSLDYGVDGLWKAGGQRIYTDTYKPLADNATNLGGYSAASYPRKAEAAVISGEWTFNDGIDINSSGFSGTETAEISFQLHASNTDYKTRILSERNGTPYGTQMSFWTRPNTIGSVLAQRVVITPGGDVGINTTPSERLHVDGNILSTGFGRFTGGENTTPASETLKIDRFGIIGNRGVLHITNASGGTIEFNVGATHGSLRQLRISSGGVLIDGTSTLTGAVTAGGNVGTSNFASQALGWRVTPDGEADFRHIYTDELQAKAFTADISQALVGSDILTKSVAKLAQNFTVTANGTSPALYVEEIEGFPGMQVFAVDDILRIRIFDRSGGGLLIKDVWVEVAAYVSTTANVQRYTVNMIDSGGVSGSIAYAGSMVLDYGQSGDGVIERTVLDAQGSPYSRVKTWVNNPWTPGNYTIHYQSGNLDGLSNASGWGIKSENTFLTGKILAGDLTKQGSYMEYANGLLKVKGRIEAEEGLIANWKILSAYLESGTGKMRIGGGSVPYIQMRPDWTVAGDELLIYATSPTNWGIAGKVGNAEVFRLGSTNQISGWGFNSNEFSSKDGLIELNATENAIKVKNSEQGNFGVFIGDVPLTDATFFSKNLNSNFKSSISTLSGGGSLSTPSEGSYSPVNFTFYIVQSGSVVQAQTTAANLVTNLDIGQNYVAEVLFYVQLMFDGSSPSLQTAGTENADYPSGGRYTISDKRIILSVLDANNSVIGTKTITHTPTAGLAGIAVPRVSFVATTTSIKYRVQVLADDARYWFHDVNTRNLIALKASMQNYNSASYPAYARMLRPGRTDIAPRGFQTRYSPTKFFKVIDDFDADYDIQAQGSQEFLSENGLHGLRITESGIEKKVNGGAWTTL